MNAYEPVDPQNNDQPTSRVDTPDRTSGTKPGKNKSLTLPLIVGAVTVVVAGAAGFAMGSKNSESELASANEEIYSLQQQLEEQESEPQTQINKLKNKNLETHHESLKPGQAAVAAYNCERVLNRLNAHDTHDYMPAEAGAEPTSWRSLGVDCFCDFEEPGGEIVILVGGQANENNSGERRNGDKTGYLGSLQVNRIQLNICVSDFGPQADAEEKVTDIAEKVGNAAKLNKKQGTEEQ